MNHKLVMKILLSSLFILTFFSVSLNITKENDCNGVNDPELRGLCYDVWIQYAQNNDIKKNTDTCKLIEATEYKDRCYERMAYTVANQTTKTSGDLALIYCGKITDISRINDCLVYSAVLVSERNSFSDGISVCVSASHFYCFYEVTNYFAATYIVEILAIIVLLAIIVAAFLTITKKSEEPPEHFQHRHYDDIDRDVDQDLFEDAFFEKKKKDEESFDDLIDERPVKKEKPAPVEEKESAPKKEKKEEPANSDLLAYVKQCRESGFGDEQIRQMLIEAGYTLKDIKNVL